MDAQQLRLFRYSRQTPTPDPHRNPSSSEAQREATADKDNTRPGSPLCYSSATAAGKAEQQYRQLRLGNGGISTKHKYTWSS